MAAPDIRTVGRLLGGSGLVVGFVLVGVAGTKVMGFRSPVVGVMVVVLGRGAAVGGIALGLVVVICCRVVLMELLFFVKSPMYVVMKVRAAAMVKCRGAGCRGTGFVGGILLPLVLDKLALTEVSSSIESMTQV